MSERDEDYFDDPEMLDFDETLEARAAAEETDPNEAFGLKIFGPTGRGSPAMGRQSPYQLSRNAAASLRSVGFEDESHLKDTRAWDTKVKEEEPQPKPKPLPKVVKAAKARPPQQYRNQFSDNDENAQVAADKFWLSMGHPPLRHRVGEEYEKMMQERARPQRNKGGTRKRNTKKRSKKSIRRNKKSNRKNKRSSSRRSKKSRNKRR
jgi:hypothetical protein